MTIRVAINGFGRIGRSVFRILSDLPEEFEVVAINDLYDNKALSYLLKYDTVMGTFDKSVNFDDEALYVNEQKILMTNHRDPADWGQARHRFRHRIGRRLHGSGRTRKASRRWSKEGSANRTAKRRYRCDGRLQSQ